MSELAVGSLSGLAANSYVVDIANGSTLDITNAAGTLPSAQLPAGSILQVVNDTHSTEVTTSSTSYIDSGLELTITPSSASSKIFLISSVESRVTRSSSNSGVAYTAIFRGATELRDVRTYGGFNGSSSGDMISGQTITYYDSPATTSPVTYKVRLKISLADSCDFFDDGQMGVLTAIEVAG